MEYKSGGISSFLKEFLENFVTIKITLNPKSIEEKLYNLQNIHSL